jgi:hypothetical protein
VPLTEGASESTCPGRRTAAPHRQRRSRVCTTTVDSLWSLVSVGPFAGHQHPLGHLGRPPTCWRRVDGHYSAFNYYEPSDSSEGVGLPFPAGYSVAYPTSTDPSTGPPLDHRPPEPSGTTSHVRTARDPTRSRWITSSTMSPRPAEITAWSPHLHRSFLDEVWSSAGKSPHPGGLLSVHCSFEPAALPPPPPDPSSPRRPGHQLLNFNDQSSGRTLTSSSMKLPAVPRRGRAEALPSFADRGGGGGSPRSTYRPYAHQYVNSPSDRLLFVARSGRAIHEFEHPYVARQWESPRPLLPPIST